MWCEVWVVLFSVASGGVFGAYGLYVVSDVVIAAPIIICFVPHLTCLFPCRMMLDVPYRQPDHACACTFLPHFCFSLYASALICVGSHACVISTYACEFPYV